jgi:hypothetical protein
MSALSAAAEIIASGVRKLPLPDDDPVRAAALTVTYACAEIDVFITSAGLRRVDDGMALAARSLMLDMVAYRLLESAGGAP